MQKIAFVAARQRGFTVVEFLVVMVVVATLATLAVGSIQDSRARGRDAERVTDIDTIHSRLEEYFSDKGGYPHTFSTATFAGLDPQVLKDPNGVDIAIVTPASDQSAAQAVTNPTNSGANYKYIPYPTGCTVITCTGYILKTYVESPNITTPNPYIKTGLSNN